MRALALLLAAFLSLTATAQPWPQKPVKFIVPFPPGGATDIAARLLGEQLTQAWGQSVIIENRGGAGGGVGAAEAARAAPDGYTLFFPSGSVMTANQYVYAQLNYDPEKDFVPVTMVVSGPQVLVVQARSPYRTVKDLIDAAKKIPGKMTNASSATGSPGHVGAELFKFMAGIEAVHVPYRGGAAATTDLIAGRVTFMFESLNSISPHAKSGAVRALAVSGERRSVAFPDLPTVAEAGVPGYAAPTWSGLIGPAGMPRPVLDKLNAAVNKAIRTEAFKERFASIGDEPGGGTPEEFGQTIKLDLAKWKDVVQRSGAKLE